MPLEWIAGTSGGRGRHQGRWTWPGGRNADPVPSLSLPHHQPTAFKMAEQIEKSFQKQPLFHNTKFATSSKKVGGKDRRWYKDVGLGFKVGLGRCASIQRRQGN
jgi:hypothetical protein